MRWSLHYHQSVSALLRSLREDGSDLHNRIKSLQNEPTPWIDALALPGGMYEIEFKGYWIAFAVDKERKVLIIVYIDVM